MKKYSVRVERKNDVIAVSRDGDAIWSASDIDGKKQEVMDIVKKLNKYGYEKKRAKEALSRAFPVPAPKRSSFWKRAKPGEIRDQYDMP